MASPQQKDGGPLRGRQYLGGGRGMWNLIHAPIIAWKNETVKKKVKYFFP
jgi:hypothetical protein